MRGGEGWNLGGSNLHRHRNGLSMPRVERVAAAVLRPIARLGARATDSDEIRIEKLILLAVVMFGALPILVALGLLNYTFEERITGLTLIGCAVLMLVAVVLLGSTSHFYQAAKFAIHFIGLLAAFLGTITLGGLLNSGFSQLWGFTVPLVALVVYTPRTALWWFAAFLGSLLGSVLLQPYLRTTNNLPPLVLHSLAAINAIGFTLLNFVTLFYVFRMLRTEQERSESLLLNILPKDIAAILKQEHRVIADEYDSASILFADVVNFTPMSAQMHPVELVDLLNEVFSVFDTLADKYGLEKVKTIGDCYMVAAGVPRPSQQHASMLTRFALDIQNYVRSHTFQGRQLTFRIGINSGPVTAGVIGRRKFAYDMWGDAVNTASRMESHGSSGTIQITEATYSLIKDSFVCEPRGAIEVKGKGLVRVWHVVDKKV